MHVGLCVITPHRVPVWGWVCTCTWGRACTGTGCARAKLRAVLAQCLHSLCAHMEMCWHEGWVCTCTREGACTGLCTLAQHCGRCTRAQSLHRSSFARGLSVGLHTGACLHGAVCSPCTARVCLHGAACACTGLCPQGGPCTVPQQLRVPLARGLAQELPLPGLAHAFPWHGAFAQGALHEAALAQAWQLGTGGAVLTRGARVPLHGPCTEPFAQACSRGGGRASP